MSKKEKLVTFEITTRVVVEEDTTDEIAIDMAVDKIKANPDGFIAADFLKEICDDEECPYGTLEEVEP